MHRTLFIVFLAIASKGTMAAWEVIHSDDVATVYADPSTIRRTGDAAKMRHLTDFTTAKVPYGGERYMYSSSTFHNEYDCKDERVRVLSFSWYALNMAKGRVVYGASKPGMWEPAASESFGMHLWQFACGNP